MSWAGRTDTWISNLSIHRNFPQSLVKDSNLLDPRAEVLGSGSELLGWGLWDDSKAGDLLYILGQPKSPESHDLPLP